MRDDAVVRYKFDMKALSKALRLPDGHRIISVWRSEVAGSVEFLVATTDNWAKIANYKGTPPLKVAAYTSTNNDFIYFDVDEISRDKNG